MIFTVESADNKAADWKVVTVREAVEGGRTYSNVSVNRKKFGTDAVQFADFDQIAQGYSFEADLWTNPTNQKMSLFPPKAQAPRGTGAPGGAARAGAITKAQDHKAELIEAAQDRKEKSIQLAGAMRDATLVTIASLKDQPFPSDGDFKREWENWVRYFLGKAEEPFI